MPFTHISNIITPKIIVRSLQDKKVVDFVKKAFVESYERHFYQKKKEVSLMVNKAFDLLEEVIDNGHSVQKLEEEVIKINKDIFKTENKDFWFTRDYQDYKKNVRSKIEFEEIKPFVNGSTVLDFGSGAGSLSVELEKRKFEVKATDVLDYRIDDAKQIDFKIMGSLIHIPFDDNEFDLVLAKMVLHHIDKENLSFILEELHRVGRRLIIEETIPVSKTDPGIMKLRRKQPIFDQFLAYERDEQLLILSLTDFFTNALAYGKPEMNIPFSYRSLDEWEEILEDHDFRVVHMQVNGYDPRRVTPDSRAIIICDTD